MACRPAGGRRGFLLAVQGHQLAHRGGAAWSLPLSNREREWTPRRSTLLCSPSCRCSAQSPLGQGIEPFLARPFLRSVHSLCSAQPIGGVADMAQLVLKRAAASRLSGEWSEDDTCCASAS